LEKGEYAQAIEELRLATQLMPTNALAFNYLGLALHQAGQSAEAERAYLRALSLDHDLTEVHYDFGCLLLSQSNRLDQAKSELTAFTMRRPNSAEGWLKLGQAQLRARELAAADRSLDEAVRLDAHNPEALTALGVVRCQRRRASEGAQLFARALKEQPGYAPALLNSAVVAQQELNEPRLALQKYREYVALKPTPDNAKSVEALIQQLVIQLNPAPHEPSTNVNLQAPAATNLPKPATLEAHAPALAKTAPQTTSPHPQPVVKSEQPTNVGKISPPASVPHPAPPTNVPPAENVQTVKLAAEPVIKPADDLMAPPASRQKEQAKENQQASAAPGDTKPQKRGFFERINPISLFGRDAKPSAPSTSSSTQTALASTIQEPKTEPPKFPRYSYLSPAKPEPGDRTAAEQAFRQGIQKQQGRRFSEAVQFYRRATQLDPAFYDAQYNLGLAAAESGNIQLALSAYETSLAIEPESLDARYNFGLVLKQAGYALDAVTQFENILERYPNDARAHLALGNLYAQQLQDVSKARQHYQAVLAVAPQSPQAGAIRYWLSDHPR
jgi:tetratricopeptide (TPR) repeat protein